MNDIIIIVTIAAGPWARNYIAEKTTRLKLKDGSNISDALDFLGIPPDEIGLIAVNGKAEPQGFKLRGGDRIEIFPVIVGG